MWHPATFTLDAPTRPYGVAWVFSCLYVADNPNYTEVAPVEPTCKTCGGEHHAVMPRCTITYYQGAQFYVSTRLVPTVLVTAWQGVPHATASRQWKYYRDDMYNAETFPYLARGARRG